MKARTTEQLHKNPSDALEGTDSPLATDFMRNLQAHLRTLQTTHKFQDFQHKQSLERAKADHKKEEVYGDNQPHDLMKAKEDMLLTDFSQALVDEKDSKVVVMLDVLEVEEDAVQEKQPTKELQ